MNFYRNKFRAIIFFVITLSPNTFAYDLCENIVNAAWRGDYENVKSLIERGANPNCEYANKSALFAAARYGRQLHWDENIEVVKLLVEKGADINYVSKQSDGEQLSSAYIAALFHHIDTALYLVEHGGSLEDVEKGYADRLKRERTSAASVELLGNLFNAAFDVPKDNDVSKGYKSFKDAYMEEMQSLAQKEIEIGIKYEDKKDYQHAIYWYKAAAKWDNGRADLLQGTIYFSDLENYIKAFQLFEKSAEKGYSGGKYMLGVFYEHGEVVVQKNLKKALYWYNQPKEGDDYYDISQKQLKKICSENYSLCK